MDHALIQLIAATAAFVISHFVMSGPIRSRLQSMLGGQGFLLFYSLGIPVRTGLGDGHL